LPLLFLDPPYAVAQTPIKGIMNEFLAYSVSAFFLTFVCELCGYGQLIIDHFDTLVFFFQSWQGHGKLKDKIVVNYVSGGYRDRFFVIVFIVLQ
jgi:hypothetical protein